MPHAQVGELLLVAVSVSLFNIFAPRPLPSGIKHRQLCSLKPELKVQSFVDATLVNSGCVKTHSRLNAKSFLFSFRGQIHIQLLYFENQPLKSNGNHRMPVNFSQAEDTLANCHFDFERKHLDCWPKIRKYSIKYFVKMPLEYWATVWF